MPRNSISKGEVLALTKELEACVGPAKQRGCLICRNGDQRIVKVARDANYPAEQVAEFLIKTRRYPAAIMSRDVVYRHWYRCDVQEPNGSN